MTEASQPLPGVPWFDVADPASPALDELARKFRLHELQIEDCRHRPQRAKAEEHEHYVFIVLKHLHADHTFTFDDVDVFVGRDFIITVHERDSTVVDQARQRAEQQHVVRVDRLLYLLVDTIVDGYLPVLDQLADEISDIEGEVLERPEPDVLARIFLIKRKLVEFRRVSGTMREVVNAVMRREQGLIGDDLDPYFRDIYDHLVRTSEFIESYRDLLTGSLDIYLSAVANRTNQVMKVLTVWGTVALPFVIVTGFFGMNLHMPWAEHRWGALYALVFMAVLAGSFLLYLRRKRWL